jgi:hypothetical protein
MYRFLPYLIHCCIVLFLCVLFPYCYILGKWDCLREEHDYSIAVITFYLLRPLKLTNQNQSQIQSVQLFIHHICHVKKLRLEFCCQIHNYCFRF